MKKLADQRCFNHELREAAARCPECGRYFCRECITEHEGRVLCAGCLGRLTEPGPAGRLRFSRLIRPFQWAAGLLIIWIFFYYLGQILLALPASFHEGAAW